MDHVVVITPGLFFIYFWGCVVECVGIRFLFGFPKFHVLVELTTAGPPFFIMPNGMAHRSILIHLVGLCLYTAVSILLDKAADDS